MSLLKVAVVGLRGHAARHIKMVQMDPLAELYRVFYHRPAPSGAGPLPVTHDFSECFQADVLIVSSPTTVHTEHMRALIDYPGYVLLEKPAANRREDIKQLLGLSEDLKSRTRVNFNFLFHTLAVLMGELLQSPMLGVPFGLDVHISHGGATRADWQNSWRLSSPSGLGPVETVGIHFVQFAQVHFGRCTSAVMRTRSLCSGSKAIDTGMVSMQMENEVWVNIQTSYAAPYGIRFNLWGSNGYFSYDGQVASLYSPRDTFGQDGLFTAPPVVADWTINYANAWQESLVSAQKNLLDAARQGLRFNPEDFDRDVRAMDVLLNDA